MLHPPSGINSFPRTGNLRADDETRRPLNDEVREQVMTTHPDNEPILTYAPGTPERAALKSELERQRGIVVEVPCVIDGEHVLTGRTIDQVIPHDHQHVIARVHLAGPDEIRRACDGAALAQEAWIELGLEARTAILDRAADLLAGPYRQRLNATTMLNQSKTVQQAEIDARVN